MFVDPLDKLRATIAELQEENAFLKRELGLQRSAEATSRMIAKWKLTPIEARLLEHLAACRGRLSSKEGIMGALYAGRPDEPEIKIVDVLVCKLRHKIGASAIKTEWGRGYRLTPDGLALVDEVMATPMAEIRPTDTPAPRPKRTNLQARALTLMTERGDFDITALAEAIGPEMTYAQSASLISCMKQAGRVTVADWRRMPDGKKRTIYRMTPVGAAYLRKFTPAV